MSKKIEIKDTEVLKEIIDRKWHPILWDIISFVAEKYGLCITQGWREALRPGDVHNTNPLRAIDLRHWFYSIRLAEKIEKEINDKWQYDPERPEMGCAYIHENRDGKGVHFHIQVHPNTVLKDCKPEDIVLAGCGGNCKCKNNDKLEI